MEEDKILEIEPCDIIRCPDCDNAVYLYEDEVCPDCEYPIAKLAQKITYSIKRIRECLLNPELSKDTDTMLICPICGKVYAGISKDNAKYLPGKCPFCKQTIGVVDTHIPVEDAKIAWGSSEPGSLHIEYPDYEEKIRELFFKEKPENHMVIEVRKANEFAMKKIECFAANRKIEKLEEKIRELEEQNSRLKEKVEENDTEQKRTRYEEIRSIRSYSNSSEHAVKCPACGSTNVTKISGKDKALKMFFWGTLAAGEVAKTFKCESCGYKF